MLLVRNNFKNKRTMKKAMKISLLILSVVVTALILLKKVNERSTAMDSIISANIEALANGEGGVIDCLGTGCVVCPRNGMKVRVVLE